MPYDDIPAKADVLVNMGIYVDCWRQLDITYRNVITEDIRLKYSNPHNWRDFTSFLANYTTVVERMLKRTEDDNSLTIWTMWGQILEIQRYGI